ncbi:cytochrome c oxidase, subunit II [Pseudobdellovibrio exovorus JSS]|uniref:Cytochrome c oxidase subunit 2 n=2 Tax=Pseudobdellovibrio exovorus TaxID=453816 RepID=M4V651_9BACT|nr:cytochrome c oxidase subunit II [Pseudobdellovibrio exovorus]AGH94668.1 cytochrome c oxidase, subunit II [Pseudobdellovibrio exovorus JSS]
MAIWMLLMNKAMAGSFMPEQGTQIAKQVDNLYGFLLVVSFISCAILIGGMIYFVLKYKRKSAHDKTAYITHDTRLEVLWSAIPLIIFLVVFAWGWVLYHDMRKMPENALEIMVMGRQWSWTAEYKNGVKSSEIVVPVGKDVKLILGSEDVIHSFFVPSFRIKQDAVPGRYTSLWFNATKLGEFHVFCTEYCGTSHAAMITRLKVVTQEEFDKWLIEESEVGLLPIAERGAKYFQTRACASCHNVDNPAAKIGPSLYQRWGKEAHLSNGTTVPFDENYVRESMMLPQAQLAAGFSAPSPMPSYQGQLSESELAAIIEYIKGLN